MIESTKNPEVARIRGLSRHRRDRRRAGRFVVEGPKLVAEALASPLTAVQVFVLDGHDFQIPDAEIPDAQIPDAQIPDVPVTVVSEPAFARMASTSSPQPVLAEVELPAADWSSLSGAVLVVVDGNDPGNLGTLARSAEAAGFGGVVALGNTVDPWGPKAVRASAGAVLRLPVVEGRDIAAGLGELAERGYRRIGTRMTDAPACDRTDLVGSVAIVLGNETHGIADPVAAMIDQWVSIPMSGRIESLNVAMAGAILSYEVARQRRHAA